MFSSTHSALGESSPPLRDLAVQRAISRRADEASVAVEAILAAGRQIIERDGVLDINVRELLSSAGVSNRAFYRYFPSKDAVIAALAEELYSNLIVSLAAAVAGCDEPTAQLEAWIDEVMVRAHDPAMASRGRVFVAHDSRLREEHRDLYRAVGRALTSQVSMIIDGGRASGVFASHVGVAEARLVTRLVMATLQHHVLSRSTPTAAERSNLLSFVFAALGHHSS
ncbi:MAG: TetR/AcrR family transcriptional regulator [Acidimicrobiia bacterium]